MLEVEVDNRSGVAVDVAGAGALARAVLAAEGVESGELGLAFVDPDEIRALKAQHLGINEATDTIRQAHETDRDGYDENNLYAALGFHPVSTVTISPYLRYSKLNGKIDQGAFTDELDYDYSSENFQARIFGPCGST